MAVDTRMIYKSKSSFRFLNFDASNQPQLTAGLFSWSRTALGLCCLDLTSNVANFIMVYQLPSKFQNTFCFFKTC